MSGIFRVFAYDLCANLPITELPANGLAFDGRLNDSGGISFTLDLFDPRAAAAAAPFLQYLGNPVALWVDLDGALVWGGWSKTLNYQHSAHVAQVTGKEFLDYFSQRFVGRDYLPTDEPWADNGIDPGAFMAQAIGDAQSQTLCGPGANINVSVYAPATSLNRIKPNYLTKHATVGQVVYDAVTGAAVGIGGLDVVHRNVYSAKGGSPNCTLVATSPRAGRVGAASPLAINLGATVDFTWPADVQQACTHLTVTGAGSGPAAPSLDVVAPGVNVGGLGGVPRIDKAIQHSTVSNPNWLAQLAYGESVDFAVPVTTPTVTIRTSSVNCPLGKFPDGTPGLAVGDDVRCFSQPSEFFPYGLDQTWRIVAYQVNVPDDDNPTVTLTLNAPPIF